MKKLKMPIKAKIRRLRLEVDMYENDLATPKYGWVLASLEEAIYWRKKAIQFLTQELNKPLAKQTTLSMAQIKREFYHKHIRKRS